MLFQRGGSLLIHHTQIILFIQFKIIQNGMISILKLRKKIPNDLPTPKGPKVRMTVYVDADHAHDLVTRRSITGILVMLNNTLFRWVSKRQKTVETSKYGSELVASRIATELTLEVRYMLQSLGVVLDGPTFLC
jgi:hypothetical protein